MPPSGQDTAGFAPEDPDDLADAGFASDEDAAGSRRRGTYL